MYDQIPPGHGQIVKRTRFNLPSYQDAAGGEEGATRSEGEGRHVFQNSVHEVGGGSGSGSGSGSGIEGEIGGGGDGEAATTVGRMSTEIVSIANAGQGEANPSQNVPSCCSSSCK
ncbi:hypothetical protein C5167_026621 [Papaver somniferum]|nr:hypothetical protein C5167_026621 [Papaver somniferum]